MYCMAFQWRERGVELCVMHGILSDWTGFLQLKQVSSMLEELARLVVSPLVTVALDDGDGEETLAIFTEHSFDPCQIVFRNYLGHQWLSRVHSRCRSRCVLYGRGNIRCRSGCGCERR